MAFEPWARPAHPDLPAARHPGAVGWTSLAITVAVGLLLLINAESVKSWVAQRPAGPATLAARQLAEQWWGLTDRLGLAAPRAALSEAWRRACAARWPGQG